MSEKTRPPKRPGESASRDEKKGTVSPARESGRDTVPFEGSSAQVDRKITKSNTLIEASYRLTLQEQRLLLTCIGRIDSRLPMEEQRVFRVQAAEFQARFGLSREKAYEELKEVAARLFERKVEIQDPITGVVSDTIRWVSASKYLKGQGAVQLNFAPEILPYISQIRERFTTYSLEAVSGFTSAFALRLYELLGQYRKFGKRTAPVEDLRRWLDCVETFERFSDFDRWVISVAVAQINAHSDLRVTYTKIKQGRSVTHIEFVFASVPQVVHQKSPAEVVPLPQKSPAELTRESPEESARLWRAQMRGYGYDPDTLKSLEGLDTPGLPKAGRRNDK